jgi:radical SAM protein with 4Fe4S-binding SPASM domain
MANLSITRRCRRRCRYCFAQYELARDHVLDMPPEVYEAALAFLVRSGVPEVRLLGGEPTEHPQFCEYVAAAHGRGFRVLVFSGGLIPQPVLEYMATLAEANFSVVLNAADPASDPDRLIRRQQEVCRALGHTVMLGVNIQSPDQDAAHVFDWVNEYGLCRTVRLGIAHPIWGGNNEFLSLRGLRTIPALERMVTLGRSKEVDIGFDCGFTPCMFTPGFVASHVDLFTGANAGHPASGAPPVKGGASAKTDAQEVAQMSLTAVGVRCNPVIDILPEGDCISCYALSCFRRLPLPSEGTRNEVVSAFDDELSRVLPVGVHPECAHCDYRARGMCNGGCRARRSFRLRPNSSVLLDAEPQIEAIDR